MKTVINPCYDHLTEFINNIPDYGYPWDFAKRARRNSLQKVTVGDLPMVIKRYRRPTIANCFVYTFLRKNKPQRAYEYATRLLANEIDTARPIAYIVRKKYGLYHTGYFVSTYVEHPLLETIVDYHGAEERQIAMDFARFTVDLHEKNIAHRDFGLGNILFWKEDDRYKFSMIDINRMKFKKKLSREDCLESMRRLGFDMPTMAMVAEEYAGLRGWNPELFCGRLMIKKGFRLQSHIKRGLKSLLASVRGFCEVLPAGIGNGTPFTLRGK